MNAEVTRKMKWKIKGKLIGTAIGYMLIMSGYSALVNLQSTLNITGGVGKCYMVYYNIG